MRGRDPNTLLAAVQRWHAEMNAVRAMRPNPYLYEIKSAIWKSCGVSGFSLKEDGITYTIKELLSTDELWEEGKSMHHCVASYSKDCADGKSAIYSLTAKTEDKENNSIVERLVTIEIKPSRKEIVQARKLQNAKPDGDDLRIMKMWASKLGLRSIYMI
jgi:hypothetical protein